MRNNFLSTQFHPYTTRRGMGVQTKPQGPWNQFCVQ
jgi:hypothetical protein